MAGTDAGIVVYSLICSVLLVFFTTSTLFRYRHESVTNLVSFVVWISWTLCLLITFLLPLDLRPNAEDTSSMLPLYESLYWVCFFLTWVLTPFFQAYVISGSFTRKQRILDALGMNVLFFTIVGISGVIGFFYLLFATSFSPSQIGAVAQSFANLWGLSFAIMAMGYGLIEIPRKFWYHSDYRKKIDYLYFELNKIHNEQEEANDRLDEWLYCYKKAKKKFERIHSDEFTIIDGLINNLPTKHNDISISSLPDITEQTQTMLDLVETGDDDKFTKRKLGKIHFWLKKWSLEMELNKRVYLSTMIQVLSLEGLLDTKYGNSNGSSMSNSKHGTRVRTESPSNSPHNSDDENDSNKLSIHISRNNNNGVKGSSNSNESSVDLKQFRQKQLSAQELDNLPFFQRWCLKFQLHALPYLQKFCAVFLGILTIIVIWSEAASVFDVDLSIFSVIVHNSKYVIFIYTYKNSNVM